MVVPRVRQLVEPGLDQATSGFLCAQARAVGTIWRAEAGLPMTTPTHQAPVATARLRAGRGAIKRDSTEQASVAVNTPTTRRPAATIAAPSLRLAISPATSPSGVPGVTTYTSPT